MKAKIPYTIHTFFRLDTDIADAAGNIMQCASVLVDGVCSLHEEVFSRIMDVKTLASRLPTSVVMVDLSQLEQLMVVMSFLVLPITSRNNIGRLVNTYLLCKRKYLIITRPPAIVTIGGGCVVGSH